MADEYKTFNITGGAAAEYLGDSKKKRVRKTAKAAIKQEGGMAMPSVAPIPDSVQTPVIHVEATSPQLQQQQQLEPHLQQDGTKHIKVELKRKSTAKKVKLHPKKDGVKKATMSKKARKVSIGLLSLHKRVRRAQKTQKKVKAMSLEDLKKELISKKLIKATSKAPESVLRQIASDSRIMEKRAL